MKTDHIIQRLKERGARITRSRQSIIAVFEISKKPLTAGELMDKLDLKNESVNKTTVYRELDFLEEENIIANVRLADGETRYELASPEHRHHIFCLNCKKINLVKLANNACALVSAPATDGFKVLGHSIELFGLCADCRKTANQKQC